MKISWRALLSIVLLSYLGAITFCNAANATPPAGGDAVLGTIVNTTNGNAHWVESVYLEVVLSHWR